MAYCPECGATVYTSCDSFCSEDCKQKYEINSITLNKTCCVCGGPVLVKEGFYVKGKKVYCSEYCLIK
jgi:hypothetical protein